MPALHNPCLLRLAARSDATVGQLVDAFCFYAEGGRGFIPSVTIAFVARLRPSAEQREELLRLARFGLEAVRAKNTQRVAAVSEAGYQRVIDHLTSHAS